MELLPSYIKLDEIKPKVILFLQVPSRLRAIVILGIGIMGIGIFGIPLRMKMRALESELENQTTISELITGIQNMRATHTVYLKNLNSKGDINWWIEYVLNGSRKFEIKVREFKPNAPKVDAAQPGEFKGYLLGFRIVGDYVNVFKFVNWIESNRWSMRISRLILKRGDEVRTPDGKTVTMIDGAVTIAILTSKTDRKVRRAKDLEAKKTPKEKVEQVNNKNPAGAENESVGGQKKSGGIETEKTPVEKKVPVNGKAPAVAEEKGTEDVSAEPASEIIKAGSKMEDGQ